MGNVYTVVINKQYRYIRVYEIVKRIGKNQNKFSKMFEKFVNKLVKQGQ